MDEVPPLVLSNHHRLPVGSHEQTRLASAVRYHIHLAVPGKVSGYRDVAALTTVNLMFSPALTKKNAKRGKNSNNEQKVFHLVTGNGKDEDRQAEKKIFATVKICSAKESFMK
jgi:hypothetical protein